MAETHKSFTPEQRIAFDEKYNLGVYSHESIIELLMRQEKKINEIAKHTRLPDILYLEWGWMPWGNLFDKWNSTANEDHN